MTPLMMMTKKKMSSLPRNHGPMTKEAIESSIGWYEIALLACALLVALGVVGEFVLGFMHWRLTNQLQAMQKQELAAMKTDAANANAQAAVANEKVAQLNLRTEELHKENLQLESDLSPRVFRDQLAALQALSKYKSVQVIIQHLPDLECKRTAGKIAFVLHEAQWTILSQEAVNMDTPLFDGVMVSVDTAGIVPENVRVAGNAAESLVAELNKTAIKAARRAPELPLAQGVILVRVGMKSNPAAERLSREWQEKLQNAPEKK
jgi:hypothetical protein